VSSFDDEFGLFGEDAEDAERRPTLGARKISTGETIINDVEPEDAGPPRRREPRAEPSGRRGGGSEAPARIRGVARPATANRPTPGRRSAAPANCSSS